MLCSVFSVRFSISPTYFVLFGFTVFICTMRMISAAFFGCLNFTALFVLCGGVLQRTDTDL